MNNFDEDETLGLDEEDILGLKAYRLAKMNDDDWSRVKSKYHDFEKTDHIVPSFLWYFLFYGVAITSGLLLSIPKLFALIAIALFFTAYKIGTREGQQEGFMSGYTVGKADGVCIGLGIPESRESQP